MRTSEATDKLFAAIAAAQAEMPDVGKEAVNPHFKNNYARLEDVIHVVRPILAKYKLCFIVETGSIVDERGLVLSTGRVALGEQWVELDCYMKPRALDCQQVGGVSTYARRYILGKVFNIACAEPDDDGNKTSVSKPKNAAPKVPKPPTDNADMNAAIEKAKDVLGWNKPKLEAVWKKNPAPALFIEAITQAINEGENLPL